MIFSFNIFTKLFEVFSVWLHSVNPNISVTCNFKHFQYCISIICSKINIMLIQIRLNYITVNLSFCRGYIFKMTYISADFKINN